MLKRNRKTRALRMRLAMAGNTKLVYMLHIGTEPGFYKKKKKKKIFNSNGM